MSNGRESLTAPRRDGTRVAGQNRPCDAGGLRGETFRQSLIMPGVAKAQPPVAAMLHNISNINGHLG